MGIAKPAVKLLMQEGLQRPFYGSILTLGRQSVLLTFKQLLATAESMGYPLKRDIALELSSDPGHRRRGFVSDRFLFLSLGFAEVFSLDYSDYEQSDYLGDLNIRNIFLVVSKQFDFVLDSGTIEHIFHLPNALGNIFDLTRVGGRIMHLSPSSNYLDHGFYMFSPTLFFDFYTANAFKIEKISMIKHARCRYNGPWRIYDYIPGKLDKISSGGLDGGFYGIALIAMKTAQSTSDNIPQQGIFTNRLWLQSTKEYQPSVMKEMLKKIPGLQDFVLFLRKVFLKKGLRLPLTDVF